jgi:[acyl-carrier-protein] S-malonyltransferase
MMQPAADVMAEALATATMNAPIIPLIANVTADQVSDPDEIRALLVKQVTGTVRWREGVLKMGELGVTQLVEVGAGKVLTGLVKRINPDIAAVPVNSPDDIEAFLDSL